MKKYAMLAFATVFMFNVSLMGQDQSATKKANPEKVENKKGGGIEKRVSQMALDLGLSDAEKTSVMEIMVKQDAEFKKFRAENDKENPDFKQKFKELRQKSDAELTAVIGAEKFKKWQAIRAEQKQKMEKKAE